MNKYNTSIIYTIKCLDNNIKDFYIGSTTNFKQRKNKHYSNCYNENNKEFNKKLYKFIRNNGGWDNFTMHKMMEINCDDKKELYKIEGQMIKYYKPSLNKKIEGRTLKQYRQDNKDKIKEYREKNKDKLKEKASEKVKCECGCMIRRSDIAKHRKTKKHINIINNI